MCGIVSAVAQQNVVSILIQGLQRLEYRGYDSCGVAVWNDGLQRARSTARVAELTALSPKTVESYIDRIRAKYAAIDRAAPSKLDLYHRAVEDGVLPREH